jgi:Kef-type K+ transport system membrane component KefB
MNCRGITELVIANVGLQNHLINTFAFTILVLIALISTAMTGLLVRLFARGTLLATPTTVEGASATDLAPTGPLTSGGAP